MLQIFYTKGAAVEIFYTKWAAKVANFLHERGCKMPADEDGVAKGVANFPLTCLGLIRTNHHENEMSGSFSILES